MGARAESTRGSADLDSLLRSLPTRVDVIVDSPRWSFAKRDDRGHVALRSPLPCPFNYGHVPGTPAPDGAELDAIVLGRRRPRGLATRLWVLGVVDFLDEGVFDCKLVVGDRVAHSPQDGASLAAFFAAYQVFKRLVTRSWSPAAPGVRSNATTLTRGIFALDRQSVSSAEDPMRGEASPSWSLRPWPASRLPDLLGRET